jgi:type II secretory ATPase GspE/PulE/Tfp pilus assembly ATPase PilB-like protein
MSVSSSSFRLPSDSKHVPQALLRTLMQSKPITPIEADTVLTVTTRNLADSLSAQAAVLYMVGKTANRIHLQNIFFSTYAYGLDESRRNLFLERVQQLEKLNLPVDRPIAGQAILKGQPIVLTGAARDDDFYDPVEWAPDFIIHSLVAMPLIAGDRPVGCIEVINKCDENLQVIPFSPQDEELLRETAGYASKLIQRTMNSEVVLSEREQAICLARLANCPFVEITDALLNPALMQVVGETHVLRYKILPLKSLSAVTFRVALADPMNYQLISDFEHATKMKVAEKVVATPSDIDKALQNMRSTSSAVDKAAEVISDEYEGSTDDVDIAEEENENSAPIVALANRIIEDAYMQGASDIHIEPQERKIILRYRVDGVCRVKMTIPKHVQNGLVSRLKIMSELDIAEKRLPQDGRIIFKKFNSNYDLDLRVAFAPMTNGESVVMRILDKTKSNLPLPALGFSDYNLELYREIIRTPYGMILHTGPTGSGKSMTLFAALNEISTPELKIITVEDPVEYTLGGINQLQVKRGIGLTFAAALRSFLRQDPDIILVGEIRDTETAEIAVEAALTGHLLFSTLHTNDAPSTVIRLTEMGIERFLVASTLVGICSQRLMRRLCTCKVAVDPTEKQYSLLKRAKTNVPIGQIYNPGSCERCDRTGYKGRIGVHELMNVGDSMRDVIGQGALQEQIRTKARRDGMRTLFEDAMEKVKSGISSMQEAISTVRADDSLPE